MNAPQELVLFGGSASEKLAVRVAHLMERSLGRSFVEHFPDGEINVRIDEPVRGRDVFLVQSTSPPVSSNLFELLAYADACRRSGARAITAVIPYFGYSRSDKRDARREPIMASMVAELLQAVGVGHLLTVDLHAPQIEGFFHVPVDTLTAFPSLARAVQRDLPEDVVVVSPDEGRLKVATQVAHWLGVPVAVLHKVRGGSSSAFITRVIGDVAERPCVIVDDMIATGVTIFEAANALLRAGARHELFVLATHAVFTEGADQKLQHPAIKHVFVTDSIAVASPPSIVSVVSLDRLLAAAIRRMHDSESIADLYQHSMSDGSDRQNRWLMPDASCD